MLMVCTHLAGAHDIWAEFLSRLLSSTPLRFRQLHRQDAPEFIRLDLMTHLSDVSDSSAAPPAGAKVSPLP